MRLSTLILLAGMVATSLSWADDDPYLWLENIDDEKSLEWVRAENKSTAEHLKSHPLFEELHAQAKTALNSSSRLPDVYQEEG